MTRTQFDAIVARIEKPLKGAGYHVEIRTASGHQLTGAWSVEGTGSNSVLTMACPSIGTEKPRTFHVDLSTVESVALAE